MYEKHFSHPEAVAVTTELWTALIVTRLIVKWEAPWREFAVKTRGPRIDALTVAIMRRALAALLFLAAISAGGGELRENVAAKADPTQTYTLYLPGSYDAAKKHPLLLVFDPRGRGTQAAEIFRDAAEEFGWILISSNQTRSDASHEPNVRAVNALLPEVKVYASDPRRIYAAGFSGTTMLAWGVGMQTSLLAGVIGVGGRLDEELPPAKFNFAHYGFAGTRDFNNMEMRLVDERLEAAGKMPHRFSPFDADHRWITPALARDALGWMEVVAGNERVAAKVFAADVAAADAMQGLDALRRYRAILRTYAGRQPVDAIREKVAKLEADPAVQRALADEKQWDEFEREYARSVFPRIGAFFQTLRGQESQPVAADVARFFRVKELERRAKSEEAEGATARRLLEAVFAQCGFYLTRQLFERREFTLAAAVLGVATQIHPDRWDAWYNLAAAYARGGSRRQALDALERAIANGFTDAKHLAADEDFVSLRGEKRFKEMVEK